tara:strand:- start:1458 stop:1784 length:327 start_codon:yes stop_codon:yes gene_type:complete
MAEAASPIRRPPANASDVEIDSTQIEVYYYKSKDEKYLDFVLEKRKKVSNIQVTPYSSALTRVLNVIRERGVTTRFSIPERERNRLRDIALQERLKAAKESTEKTRAG